MSTSSRDLEIRSAGDAALLLSTSDHARLPDLVELVREATDTRHLRGVIDILPAAETVLLTFVPGSDLAQARRMLLDRLTGPNDSRRPTEADGEVVTIPVRYDGEDLDTVARTLHLTPDEVVERHTSRVWRCRFIGFTAGFGYLEPEDGSAEDLRVPRRRESRTAVPMGAVALADGYSAVYPRRAPGGWQLIGTTTTRMWDIERDPASLLRPATRVQFRCETT